MTHIVFDMAGVFFTWRPWEFLQNFPELARDEAQGRELAKAIYGAPDWAEFDQGRLDDAQIAASVAKRLNLPLELIQSVVAQTPTALVPIVSTVTLLCDLVARRSAGANLRIWYLSNMPASYARKLLAANDWFDDFDGGMFSADIDMIKPNDDIFHHTAQRFDIKPSDAVFIDDHPANVVAASNLGWHTIHVHDASQLPEQLRTWLTQVS